MPRLASIVLLISAIASAAAALPGYFAVPEHMALAHADRAVIEDNASASFRVAGGRGESQSVEKHGKRYFAYLRMQPDLDQAPAEIWAAAKPSLIKSGWKVVLEHDGPPMMATLRRTAGGREVWASFVARASDESTIEIIEVAPR